MDKTNHTGVSDCLARVHTLGGGEVNDVAVTLEHVHLLNGLDGLDIELLEGSLELLVVSAGPGGRTLDLSPGSTLATISHHHQNSWSSLIYRTSSSSSSGGEDVVGDDEVLKII